MQLFHHWPDQNGSLPLQFGNKNVNQYLNNVRVSPMEITQEQLSGWAGTAFDPSKLDMYGFEKNTMIDAVVKCLKHMNDICNSNIMPNADRLLSGKEVDASVDRIGEHKKRLPPQKFKVPY